MTTSLEITVISAQGITTNKTPSLFSLPRRRLRPFITITTFPPLPPPPPIDHDHHSINGVKECHVYSTRVDDHGGPNPTWGDKFLLPLDPTFFTTATAAASCVYLHLYSKRAFLGRAKLLGWVQIPASDILEGSGPARQMSYRVRARDGSRGHGVVNVALRLAGHHAPPVVGSPAPPRSSGGSVADTRRTAIGVPVGTCLMTWRREMDHVARDVSNRSN